MALLAIVAIALTYGGYKFIRGKNVLVNTNVYYAKYNSVDGMRLSTPVNINGVQVGFVSDIQLDRIKDEVVVTFDLKSNTRIPKDAVAIIKADGFMGGKLVEIEYDAPCTDANCAKSGDYIEGRLLGMLGTFFPEEDLGNYLVAVRQALKEVTDTLTRRFLSEDSDNAIANSLRDLESTMANLDASSARLNGLIAGSSSDIQGTISNLRGITDNLEASNADIGRLISNTSQFSEQLTEVELKRTLQEVETTITNLKSTLDEADRAIAGVADVVDMAKSGDGTLGKLLQDEQLYNNLEDLSHAIDSLASDLQERPYRYVPLMSRNRVKRYDRKDAKE